MAWSSLDNRCAARARSDKTVSSQLNARSTSRTISRCSRRSSLGNSVWLRIVWFTKGWPDPPAAVFSSACRKASNAKRRSTEGATLDIDGIICDPRRSARQVNISALCADAADDDGWLTNERTIVISGFAVAAEYRDFAWSLVALWQKLPACPEKERPSSVLPPLGQSMLAAPVRG